MTAHAPKQSPWQQLAILFGMTLAGLFGGGIILGVISIIEASILGVDQLPNQDSAFFTKMSYVLASIVGLFLPALWFTRITYNGSVMDNLSVKRPVKKILYLLAIVCFFISIPLESWLIEMNEQVPAPK